MRSIHSIVGHVLLKYFPAYPDLYMRYLYWEQLRRLKRMIAAGEQYSKNIQDNEKEFDGYGDREIVQHEKSGWHCLIDGRIEWMSAKSIRGAYIEYVSQQIQSALDQGADPSVLEVGCGNCINLVELKRQFGRKVQLSGFDLSSGRISTARKHFGDELSDVDLFVASATDPDLSRKIGRRFGVVFSMHCLEQLPHHLEIATTNMISLTEKRTVFVEPEFSFGYPAQRLFLLIADHCRTLLPTLKRGGHNIVVAEPLRIQSSLKNQSSLIVIEPKRD